MPFETISAQLREEIWGNTNLRADKARLIQENQGALSGFTPLSAETYQNNRIQLMDFFSGAGGTSLGFASMNSLFPVFKMLGGCDIDAISSETYSRNFGTPVINEDIRVLANDSYALDALLDRVGYDPEKPLILIGCAPCQGFSSHRKKHWSEADDIRNSLVIAFANIVHRLQPDVVLIENVPEFLSKKYWNYYDAARQIFVNDGYHVKQSIYNAAAFGVPQERFRSIVIGMKKDFIMPSELLTPEQFHTVRQAIGNLPPVVAGQRYLEDPLHNCPAHKRSTIDVIRQVPHDGGNRPFGVGPECLDRTKGFSDTYGRLFWDKPSITITHYSRNPASGRFSHPEQDRGLTAREVAILQSFPNGFVFCGKSDDIYRQIGEAVPPMLSAAIAANILVELLSSAPNGEDPLSNVLTVSTPVSSSYSSVIAGIKQRRSKK